LGSAGYNILELLRSSEVCTMTAPHHDPTLDQPATFSLPPDPQGTIDQPASAATRSLDPQGTIDQPPEQATLSLPEPGNAPTVASVPGYALDGELGRGGMGVVYRARQMTLNRTVALKMVLAGAHARPEQLTRFLAEAEVIAKLKHANIVEVYDFGRHENLPFFALEFCSGGSLDDKLAGEPQEGHYAADVVAQLADGVAHAHAAGIIHRDLKPANVLLTATGTPKITDFGLAKQGESGMTASHIGMGTPSYMSPEQTVDASKVGPLTDVYALGAILYEMLTGRPPFRGPNAGATMALVQIADAVRVRELNPAAPRDLETIAHKCLDKDPAKRYASAEELAKDLRRWKKGEPIAARPAGVVERTVKWGRRNPALTAVFVALAVGLIGVTLALRHAEAETARAEAETTRALAAEQRIRVADADKRLARAQSLVEAVGSVEPAALGRVLADLAEVRDLAVPLLQARREQEPAGTRGWLHVRLALLADEPGLATELGAYVRVCRPEEIEVLRVALQPFAAEHSAGLWAQVASTKASAGERLRSACVLAAWAPGDAQWSAQAGAVAGLLVRQNPLEAVAWKGALVPVRGALVPALAARYAAARGELKATLPLPELAALSGEIDLAAAVLADYAADDVGTLTELCVNCDVRHHGAFFTALQKSESAAARLRAVVRSGPASLVDRRGVPTELVPVVTAASGQITGGWAYVPAMAMAEFDALATRLAQAEYRLHRLRPLRVDGAVRVCAVWWRGEGAAVVHRHGLTASALREADEAERMAGRQPVDVSAYATTAGERYAAVWGPWDGKAVRTAYYAGVPDEHLKAEQEYFKPEQLKVVTLQALAQRAGEPTYCGVMGPAGGCDHVRALVVDWQEHPLKTVCVDVGVSARPSETWRAAVLGVSGSVWGPCAVLVRDGVAGPWLTHVWQTPAERECERVGPLGLAAHAARSAELGAGGWRLESLAVPADGMAYSAWSRGLVADAELAWVAQRQALAAANVAKLGHTEEVWPLLAHSADPSRRSQLIAALPALGVEASSLFARYEVEVDVSVRRALVLALGDYPSSGVPLAWRERLLADFRTHPDAGLHGALDWLLRRRWEQGGALDAAVQEWATASKGQRPSAVVGERGWYVNGQGQTYALVRGPVEFVMGSPANEPDREGDQTERQQRVRIGRSFLVAAREVTVAEYLKFTPKYQYNPKYSPGQDTPMNTLSWYACAAYCNWLSKAEGLPASEWCYEPVGGEFKEGMRLASDYLRRKGYRLPSEAEWEYAARAGAGTSWPHGRSEAMLGRYGYYIKNSEDRLWPVGSLRPNELGLFDLCGNALEWVNDEIFAITGSSERNDSEKQFLLSQSRYRVLRGGSLLDHATFARCAYRNRDRPDYRYFSVGFRPARTYD
jgi:formylglycine-generating enzyme required for sulfatase activity